ncbi:MAG: Hpt domain-containing protein, partial [Candidatus Thorarchaeota archaeon]
LNEALLTLESEHDNLEVINEAFRLVHTVKGTAKILNINSIGELAHVTEDLLDNIKAKKMAVNQDMIDILFESTDNLTKMVTELASEGEVTFKCEEFINRIKEMIDSGESSIEIVNGEILVDIYLNKEQKTMFTNAKNDGLNIYLLAIKLDNNCKLKEGRIFQVFRELDTIGNVITSVPDKKNINEQTTSINILLATINTVKDVEAKVDGDKDSSADENGGKIDIKPGSRLELKVELENLYSDDISLEGVYVEAIIEDIKWLGFDWGERLFFASD